MEAEAREVINNLKSGLDGLSVSELLAEMSRNCIDGEDAKEAPRVIRRNGRIRSALSDIRIHANSALPEQELDVMVYGIVLEPKRLLKARPELKPLKGILEGLML